VLVQADRAACQPLLEKVRASLGITTQVETTTEVLSTYRAPLVILLGNEIEGLFSNRL
jgi:hypothetical protein